METRSILACVAFVAAFFATTLVTQWLFAAVRHYRISQKARWTDLGEVSRGATLLRKGVPRLRHLSCVLLQNKYIERFFDDLEILLIDRGVVSNPTSLCSWGCCSLALLLLGGTLISSSWVVGLLITGGGIMMSVTLLSHWKDKRTDSIREAVPDALRSMAACSHAGYSLRQTFIQVAQEIDEPLKSLFSRASHDLDAGKTIGEALEGFRKNTKVVELSFVAVALDVQHRSGGSLKKVLDSARESVENELELKRTLRVQTAQAKLSARIVSVMPFVLIALFSFLSPGFLNPFFGSVEGFALLGVAVLMQATGILAVRRILSVAVD